MSLVPGSFGGAMEGEEYGGGLTTREKGEIR